MHFHDPADIKPKLLTALSRIAEAPLHETQTALTHLMAPEAQYFANHPFNDLIGPAAVSDTIWMPLKRSFRHLRRADDMFTGGHFGGGDWISVMGYLHGTFVENFLGIPATGNWAYLRYGEFHKIESARIVRSHIIFDLPDLMRQAGVFPWRKGLGVETLMPGPQSRDGIVLGASDPLESKKSLDLVEAMIFDGLLTPAGQTSTIEEMRPFWTEDMMWYGPAMIGATMGLEQFYQFHETPWEAAILPRGPKPQKATKHVTRFGDGAYCSFTGWPSIYATHGGDFLGLPASHKPVEIRVMDFYHRKHDKLSENWIFIDFPHLFLQLGVDLFARMTELRDSR